jgi:hypothetical protein
VAALETPAADLRTKVGGLVEAIGAFNESQSTSGKATAIPGVNSPLVSEASAGSLGVTATVGGIVEALKQFDPNGNVLVSSGTAQSVPVTTALTTPTLLSPVNTGILASGK